MPNTRDSVFRRVTVDYSVRGITRVDWDLRPRFCEPPYTFQLQVSRNGGADWTDVGTAVVDTFVAYDDTPRLCGGVDQRIVYRVVLVAGNGQTYYSGNAVVLGNLSQRQWIWLRNEIRRLKLDSRQMDCFEGYLFKRRVQGEVCTVCVDPFTGGITNSDCAACHGTGFVDGYWQAGKHFMVDLTPELRNAQRDPQRGNVDDQVAMGRFIGLPLIHSRDVWVDKDGDQRYYIGRVSHKAELDQLPIVVDAELRLAEHSNVIYDLGVSDA